MTSSGFEIGLRPRVGLAAWFCSFLFLLCAALTAFGLHLTWQRKPLASSGGLYFPKRVQLPVPLYRQGDPKWRFDQVGTTPDSMGAVGCAVSSAAMTLSYYGIDTDPGRLNAYLGAYGGYTPQGWMYWETASELGRATLVKAWEDMPSYWLIDQNLLAGNPVIVRVRLPGTTHFVVIMGKDGFDYIICDPGRGAENGPYPLRELIPQFEALRFYRRAD